MTRNPNSFVSLSVAGAYPIAVLLSRIFPDSDEDSFESPPVYRLWIWLRRFSERVTKSLK
jgi:hypothetical protein